MYNYSGIGTVTFSNCTGDLRALSTDELEALQIKQMWAMQQAYDPLESLNYLSALNAYRPPERPLDERFAEFKVRLAAAIAKRANPSQT